MRGAHPTRLILGLMSLLLVAAASVGGYLQRPSQEAAAFQTYLMLGGDPADLCVDGQAPGHRHCTACQLAAPLLFAITDDTSEAGANYASLTFSLSDRGVTRSSVLILHARGPPAQTAV